jgi:hypothetical protein
MILEKVIELYTAKGRERPPTGNPTLSRAGTCQAQLQGLITKAWPPEPYRARSIITFESGDQTEQWFNRAIFQAFPNMHGLQQEAFYLPISLDAADARRLQELIETRKRWGRVIPGFQRPKVEVITRNGQRRARFSHLLPRRPDDPKRPAGYGFVLDSDAHILHAPGFIDCLWWSEELHAPVLVEIKSMSDFSFRRALTGELSYDKRAQLVCLCEATGLQAAQLLMMRKNTGHLLGFSYIKDAVGTRIQIRALSGEISTYVGVHSDNADQLKTEGGEIVPVPHDSQWEVAAVTSPWDGGLLEECRERIKRVLLTEDDPQTFVREAGPSFVCQKCDGVGRRICSFCGGTRVSKRSKTGKPCKAAGCGEKNDLPSTVVCDEC